MTDQDFEVWAVGRMAELRRLGNLSAIAGAVAFICSNIMYNLTQKYLDYWTFVCFGGLALVLISRYWTDKSAGIKEAYNHYKEANE